MSFLHSFGAFLQSFELLLLLFMKYLNMFELFLYSFVPFLCMFILKMRLHVLHLQRFILLLLETWGLCALPHSIKQYTKEGALIRIDNFFHLSNRFTSFILPSLGAGVKFSNLQIKR